ncbi:MAG: DUF5686 family protein [Chitinophagales bacterium]
MSAQKIVITGKVIEDHTEEPIPFANIFLKGTTIGTVSDMDGLFRLETDYETDSLGVSAIGYTNVFKYIGNVPSQTVNFRMVRADFMMEEVVVLAGENPADIMMRKIIKHKDEHDIDNLESYSYETYNKLELDLSDLTDDFMDKRVFKPFKFVFENIDTVSEEKPYLPMFITETLSNYYYQQDPKVNKEIIQASKISGIENESVTQFLGNMYQKIDIYENFMPVMGKNIPSPITNQALFYYKFSLVDSAFIENQWSYHLTFKPKRKQEMAFVGDMWVSDTTFAVRRISMQLVSKDVNVNFMEKLSVFQEFQQVKGTIWALKKDKLIINFISTEKAPGVIGRKSTSFKDFQFNNETINDFLNRKEEIEVAEDVFEKDESFWASARHDSLSANEQAIYAMIDTIKTLPIARTYADVITILVTGHKGFGPVEIGPYFSLMSMNAIEGFRVRLGARTSNSFSKRMKIGAYAAYGFKDKSMKYGGNALFMLSKKPRETLFLSYKNDLDIESGSQEEFGQDNLFAGFYRQPVPQKLMRIQQAKVEYTRDWKLGWSNKLIINHKRMNPYFDFYFFEENGDASQPKMEITTSEVTLNTRFAYKEKFVYGEFFRTSLGSEYPIINLDYTIGLKGVLGSDFNYHKLEFRLYDWFYVGSMGYSSINMKAGKVFGTLPFLLLQIHPGNETYFFNKYSFNCMNDYEFISDTYITFLYTHFFDGLIFNRVPLLRKLKLRSLITAKFAVGSLSDANKAANYDESGVYKNFETLNDEFDLNEWQLQTPTWDQPYIEVGVGIENILRLFRVDAIWRLTYTDKPAQVGIRTGMQFKF